MKKLAIEETFPRNDIGKNIICNRMKSHYKRIYRAKAKVDTNLPKPEKNSVPLSQEICDIVNRNYYCYRQLPKHRKCLKELEEQGFHFKPIILNSNAESKLKTLDVYHPPVKTPRSTKSRQSVQSVPDKLDEENEEVIEEVNPSESEEIKETEEQKTAAVKEPAVVKKEICVQTEYIPKQKIKKEPSYRPRSSRALNFLRDITDDVLSKGVYTDESLEGIFNYHVTVNKYKLDMETMLNEIDRLRDEVGIRRPGLRTSTHSDEEALEALDSLELDPNIKEDIITSLRLGSRESYHNAVIESQSSSSDSLTPVIKNNIETEEDLVKEEQLELKQQHQEPLSKISEQDGYEEEKEIADNIDDKEGTSTASEVSDIEEVEYNDDEEKSIGNHENYVDDDGNDEEKEEEEVEAEEKEGENDDEEKEGEDDDEVNQSEDEAEEENKKNENISYNDSIKSLTHTLSVIKEESLKELSVKSEQSLKDKSSEKINIKNNDNKNINKQIESISTEQINTEVMNESNDESENDEQESKTEKSQNNISNLSRNNSSSDMSSIHTEPSLDF